MACKVCGSTNMAKAHIFPRALIHKMKDGGPVVYGINRHKSGARNYQSGSWEDDILCQECEGKLAACDDYAVRWIRNFDRRAVPIFNGRAFEVPNPKPNLLEQFAASVLWRAAVAQSLVHPDVDLGPWETRLKEAIFERKHFLPSLFVARKRYVSCGEFHGPIVVHPYRARHWGRRGYVFELGNLLWGLKLDNRQGGEKLFAGHFRANLRTTVIVINMGDNELSEQHDIMEIFAAAEGLTWKRP